MRLIFCSSIRFWWTCILGRASKIPTGFTLIEIMVAISILAIIGAVAIPNLNGFNEKQQLENATNDLVRNLRQGQSAAFSGVECHISGISASIYWQVLIANNNFKLQVNCNDGTSIDMYSSGVLKDISLSTQPSPAGNCIPDTVRFTTGYQPNRYSNLFYFCGGTENTVTTSLQITLTKNAISRYVCINKGGAIYASAAAC